MDTLDLVDDNVTQDKARKISAINKDVVHKICSGQVVLNLATAVKELVENSLDAGATVVEIKLKEYGKDLIEIMDNGSGVTEENFSGLTLKYHTSKLREFSDLLGVSTFGFRGEALSSLCALSDLTIITRHSSVECGTKIIYDYKGEIKIYIPCSRQIGTTVSLANIFCTLPVRQKEFHRNIKREFNKMTQLLYAYCLVSEHVKIVCTNQTNKGSKSIVVATQGGTVKDNIACVFGVKQLQSLMNLRPHYPDNHIYNLKDALFSNLEKTTLETPCTSLERQMDMEDIKSDDELELSEESSNEASEYSQSKSSSTVIDEALSQVSNFTLGKTKRKVSERLDFMGFISSCSHGNGRSTTERQFFYVNSRPCEPHKLMKTVNEVYKQYNPHQSPFVFLNLKIKQSAVDVNVTPDKRKIFLEKEKNLMDIIKSSLIKIYENIPSTLKLENVNTNILLAENKGNVPLVSDEKSPRIFSSFLSQFASKVNQSEQFSSESKIYKEIKRKATTLDSYVINVKLPRKESPIPIEESIETSNYSNDGDNNDLQENKNFLDISQEGINDTSNSLIQSKSETSFEDTSVEESENLSNNSKATVYLGFSDSVPESEIVNISQVIDDGQHKKRISVQSKDRNCASIPKVVKTVIDCQTENTNLNKKIVIVNISMDQIKSLAPLTNKEDKINNERVKFRSIINPVQNKKCEDELQKEISKDMFQKMKVVGQFNLGFIITQLDEDLFIIDQHATDEKYNYEILQKTTVLSNQRLVVPQTLELTGVNERVLIDNLEVCRKNGFTFEINEEAPPTKRVKLLTIPISKNWVFGKDDIEEMLFMLKDYPQEVCRPSRVQAMFASRACRKSVMIGTALNKIDMRKLINHMGEIEQPWNCPHGRPTIRHLINMALIYSS